MDRSEDNFVSISNAVVNLSRKSWTAYVGVAIRLALLLILAAMALYWQSAHWQLILLVAVVPLALIGYQFWLLRSYRLYFDEVGVWIYSGVLPWKKGVSGVKWRDLDEAIFINNFFSWVTGAYTVQLRHRFTKAIEISEKSMAQGKQAAIAINQQQRKHLVATEQIGPSQG